MLGEHLLIFGWVELIATALIVKYLQKQDPTLLGPQPLTHRKAAEG
jgi:ABC-type Co2+ transport system permease subunit